MQNKFWSPKQRARAITLRQEGYSFGQIALRLGGKATASGVRKLWKKFEETGQVIDKSRSGRPRVSTDRQDRALVKLVTNNRRLSLRALKEEWAPSVSHETIRSRLTSKGLKSKLPRKKPLLTLQQRQNRLLWARKYHHWSAAEWSKVLWSDETKIMLFGNDGQQRIWRRKGEEFNPQCMKFTAKHPASVMVWGCMAANGVGRLQIVSGLMNARKYIDEVLVPTMMPSAHDLFKEKSSNSMVVEFIYQQDNAPCHTAKLCTEWFKTNKVKVLDWPGNSPDLNPIENLWARLKRLVAKERPNNRTQLLEAIMKCWNHVIQADDLRRLVESMPRRCEAVIKARGYSTKY